MGFLIIGVLGFWGFGVYLQVMFGTILEERVTESKCIRLAK